MQRTCPVCQIKFNTWESYIKRNQGIFCSRLCRGISRRIPLLERLFSKITIDLITSCWLWQGNLSNGYGHIRNGNKLDYCHILSYENFYMKVPSDLFVLHVCDIRNCINPDHLFLGTYKDNARDCSKKNRSGAAILKTGDILQIRTLINEGLKDREIGNMFYVNRATIRDIRLGKTWSYI